MGRPPPPHSSNARKKTFFSSLMSSLSTPGPKECEAPTAPMVLVSQQVLLWDWSCNNSRDVAAHYRPVSHTFPISLEWVLSDGASLSRESLLQWCKPSDVGGGHARTVSQQGVVFPSSTSAVEVEVTHWTGDDTLRPPWFWAVKHSLPRVPGLLVLKLSFGFNICIHCPIATVHWQQLQLRATKLSFFTFLTDSLLNTWFAETRLVKCGDN